MKKHLFSFAFLLLSVAAVAQSKVSYGIRAGVTNAGIDGEAVKSFENLLGNVNGAVAGRNKTGFYGGGFVSIPLSEKVSLEPGISYTQRGYELRGNIGLKEMDIISATSRLNLGYIELPVLVRANFKGLQLFAGPQVGYLAAANLHTRAGALGFNFINDRRNVKGQFNELDASLTGGVGYQFGNGLRVEAAYDHGFSRMISGSNVEAYNRTVKLGLGFRF
jgi:opacity protein-like surface antigen